MSAQTAAGAALDPVPVAGPEPVAAEPFEAFYRAHLDRVYRALAVTLGDPQLARALAALRDTLTEPEPGLPSRPEQP